MRNLLSTEGFVEIQRLASARALLVFDFDGTLAPIVADRHDARVGARTRDLFRRVCQRYTCAVLSGRNLPDLVLRLGDLPVRYVIGNSGMTSGAATAGFTRVVAAARSLLERALLGVAGVEFEDKYTALAIHLRRVADKGAARALIRSTLARVGTTLRVIEGNEVVNVSPLGAPDKGVALASLIATAGADHTLYVGDDATDEAAFGLGDPGLLAVRVDASESSEADFHLEGQSGVDRLLAVLLALRATVTS